MSKERTVTSQEKIIEMYKQGFSCKDICLACNMSALTVRNYLRSAGFDTRNYRKVSESNREKVVLLIKAGYPYNQIENLLHISTHLVREIVMHAGMIGFAPKNHRPVKLKIKESDISLTSIEKLKALYFSGDYGLAKCSDMLGITDKEFVWFVFHLSKEDREKHSANLKSNVIAMYKNQSPVTAIAKQMDISPSIVKKIIK